MKISRRSRRHRNPKGEKKKKPFFAKGKEGGQSFFQNTKTNNVRKKGLTIGAPDSKEEKEADTVAKQTINKQEEKLDKKPEVNRTKLATPKEYEKFGTKDEAMKHDRDIQEKTEEEPIRMMEDEEGVQKQEEAPEEPLQKMDDQKTTPSFEEVLQSTKGKGSPLPAELKAEMETKFSADFSKVRIHTGEKAIELAASIKAQAFTHGCDIYFNEGKFQPETTAGKLLLAHELTHVCQQKGKDL